MGAEMRLPAVVVGAFLLWLPALSAFLRGDLDAGALGVRFAGAAAVVWAGITLVAGIVSGYQSEPAVVSQDAGNPVGRRAADAAGPGDPSSPDALATSAVSDASDG